MCDFPAKRLLQVRRDISEHLDVRHVKRIMDAIDEVRWDHFEKTGCDCWQQAIAASVTPKLFDEVAAA